MNGANFPHLQPRAELQRNQRGEIGRQHIVSSGYNVFSSPCSLIGKFYVKSLLFMACLEITHKQHLNLPIGRSNALSLLCWLVRSNVEMMDF